MPAKMGRPGPPHIGANPIADAGAPEGFGAMRFGLIGMQAPEQTVHRIADIDAQVGEGRLFGQHSARNRPSAPEYRGVAEADTVTKHGPGPDFDEDCAPRSSKRFAPPTIAQDALALCLLPMNQGAKT